LKLCFGSELLLGGFSDGGNPLFQLSRTKEKAQMPGAALSATERPQEQNEQDCPFQQTAAFGAQDVAAPAKRAFSLPNPK